jgi:hypothetical protein
MNHIPTSQSIYYIVLLSPLMACLRVGLHPSIACILKDGSGGETRQKDAVIAISAASGGLGTNLNSNIRKYIT